MRSETEGFAKLTTDPGITTCMDALVPRRPWMAGSGESATAWLQVIVLIENLQGAFVAICRTVHNGA
jgi:hypothetical protein